MNNNYNNFDNQNYNNISKFYDAYQGFIRGNLEYNTYKNYKNYNTFEVMPINEQAKALTNIDAISFAMLDLNLYLDLHPEDRATIDLYNQYRLQCESMISNYENMYGPLTLMSPTLSQYPWMWNNRPWPWER